MGKSALAPIAGQRRLQFGDRAVSEQLQFGQARQIGMLPIIVVTTDEYDRAGASTKTGANRSGSRAGRTFLFRDRCNANWCN